MNKKKFVYWKDNNMMIGYMEEFPDYLSQGITLEELIDNLRDIYKDLMCGDIPNVRHVA